MQKRGPFLPRIFQKIQILWEYKEMISFFRRDTEEVTHGKMNQFFRRIFWFVVFSCLGIGVVYPLSARLREINDGSDFVLVIVILFFAATYAHLFQKLKTEKEERAKEREQFFQKLKTEKEERVKERNESQKKLQTELEKEKQISQKLERMATHDNLTGLPNRALLYDRLKQIMAEAERSEIRFWLAVIDLDNFKTVNDTYGHIEGDEILKRVTQAMGGVVRKVDTLSRTGGDEFTLILPGNNKSSDEISGVVGRLRIACRQSTPDGKVTVSASIGIAEYFPGKGENEEDLIHRADMNMYEAKNSGRDRVCSN